MLDRRLSEAAPGRPGRPPLGAPQNSCRSFSFECSLREKIARLRRFDRCASIITNIRNDHQSRICARLVRVRGRSVEETTPQGPAILGDRWSVKVGRDVLPLIFLPSDQVFAVLPLTDQIGRIYPTEGFLTDDAAALGRSEMEMPAWCGNTRRAIERGLGRPLNRFRA